MPKYFKNLVNINFETNLTEITEFLTLNCMHLPLHKAYS